MKDASTSDLTLVCSGGEVCVHRIVMAARSTVFSCLLKSGMEESESGIVKIDDFDIDVVRAMVIYMYTAKIEDSYEDIVTLMKIGNKYLVQSLVDECSARLRNSLTESNVLELGVVAEVHSVKDLMESCAKFVSSNVNVLKTDWKDRLKSSPWFLMSILEAIVVEVPEIYRFGGGPGLHNHSGSRVETIEVKLDRDVTLISIGLFGCEDAGDIVAVKIALSNTNDYEGTPETVTSFMSTGTKEPVRLPVNLEMKADNTYSVNVMMIFKDCAFTFCGEKEQSEHEVDCNGKLKVTISNKTIGEGQIPTLKFKISNA